MAELNWSDAQWKQLKDAVSEAFGKASVASAFLTCYGPLPGGAEIVRNERLIQDDASKPRIVRLDADHDDVNLKLVNVTVNVLLSSEQVADETLSNALLAFRRAANILAQEEDRIVFQGFDRGDLGKDSEFVVNTVRPQKGLADRPARYEFAALGLGYSIHGEPLVSAVVSAIQRLEDDSNPGPFACVLGDGLFDIAHDPARSLAIPAERI